jgi:hypothetical protein
MLGANDRLDGSIISSREKSWFPAVECTKVRRWPPYRGKITFPEVEQLRSDLGRVDGFGSLKLNFFVEPIGEMLAPFKAKSGRNLSTQNQSNGLDFQSSSQIKSSVSWICILLTLVDVYM